MAHCPECEAELDMQDDDVEEGQKMDCPECGAGLEVVSVHPLELNAVTDEEEDEDEKDW